MATLRFLRYEAPQVHGFFLHFMNAATGEPQLNSEISSVDTAVLLAGILTAAEYFSTDPEIARLAKEIYSRVDFTWMLDGDSLLRATAIVLEMGPALPVGPLQRGFDTLSSGDWLTHARHSVEAYAWKRPWVRYQNWSFMSGGPLFTHQFSHAWVDPGVCGMRTAWISSGILSLPHTAP